MAGETRLLKTKISSIRGIGKITKAMELVSASKMKRAVKRAMAVRKYGEEASNLLVRLATTTSNYEHPFQVERDKGETLIVIIGASRGLAGSFNTNILREVISLVAKVEGAIDFVTIGRPAERIAKKLPGTLLASFIELSEDVEREELRGLFKIIFDGFTGAIYREVYIVSNVFISPLVYRSTTTKFLPLLKERDKTESFLPDVVFEPNAAAVMGAIIPLLMETVFFTLVLESKAAEHSARMIAMKNASDSAEGLRKDLELVYNHSRQEAITRELSEIISGAEALTTH